MGKKLAKDVHVGGAVYKAGAEVPGDVAELITNPKAWADDQDDDSGPKKPAARQSRSTAKK